MSTYAQFKYAPVVFQPQQAQLDPVGKIRVSNPETLIDTDFEYGLQETKWETLELVNNIPFAFARQGEPAIPLESVDVEQDSDIVRVTTTAPHNFTPGTPFRLSGLRTIAIAAEGVSIVTRVTDEFTFEYRSRKISETSGEVITQNSELIPGAYYSASHYKYNELNRIYTDGGAPTSNVIVEFPTPHGFIQNTAFYVVNSVTGRKLTFDAEAFNETKGTGVRIRTTDDIEFNVANGAASANSEIYDVDRDFNIIPYTWTEDQEDSIRLQSNNIDLSTDIFEFDFEHNYGNNTPVILIPPIDWLASQDSTLAGANSTYGILAADSGGWITTNGRFYTMKYVRPINATAFRLFPNLTATAAQYTKFTKLPEDFGGNFIVAPAYPVSAVNRTTYRFTINTNALPKYANDEPRPLPTQGEQVVVLSSSIGPNSSTTQTLTLHRHAFDGSRRTYTPLFLNYEEGAPANQPQLLYTDGSTVLIRNNTLSGNASRDNNFTALLRSKAIPEFHSFNYPNHGFVDNDVVLPTIKSSNVLALSAPGQTAQANVFQHNRPYYVNVIDQNKFKLNLLDGTPVQVYRQPKDVDIEFVAKRVNPLRDRFVVPNHGLTEGTEVQYTTEGETPVDGLVGSTFYVHRPTTNTFLLSTTEDGVSSNPYTKNFNLTTATANVVSHRLVNSHLFVNGDFIRVQGGNLPVPLVSGQYYYVGQVSGTASFRLFYEQEDLANNNFIRLLSSGSGQISLSRSDVIDLTANGSGEQGFLVLTTGAVDGVFNVADVPDANTLVIQTNSQYDPKTIEVDSTPDILVGNLQSIQFLNHQLVTGLKVDYTLEPGTAEEDVDYIVAVVANTEWYANNFAQLSTEFAVANGDPVKIFPETAADSVDSAIESGEIYYINISGSGNSASFSLHERSEQAVLNLNRIQFNGDSVGSTVLYHNLNGRYKYTGIANNVLEELGSSEVYTIVASKDSFRLAKTFPAALEYNYLPIVDANRHRPSVFGNGHVFTSNSIAGEVVGLGNVSLELQSNTARGSGTSFGSYFRPSDRFRVYCPGSSITSVARTSNSTNVNVSGNWIRPEGTDKTLTLLPEVAGPLWTNPVTLVVENGPWTWYPQRISLSTTGVPPGGVEEGKLYYYRKFDPELPRIYLYETYTDALHDVNRVQISSVGSGAMNWTVQFDDHAIDAEITKVSGFFKVDFKDEIDFANTFINPYGENNDVLVFRQHLAQDLANLEYAITTSFIARTEGLVLHRPHDGGVELLPALSPDARLTRQTRRYFRYQSGKGFQVSMAVNFNAPSDINEAHVTGYYIYDINIADGGTGYSNGDIVQLHVPNREVPQGGYALQPDRSIHVKLNANGFIQTDSSGAITKVVIANTGCDYWTANTKIVIMSGENEELPSDGVNANLVPLMTRGSFTVTTRSPHRMSPGLAITTIDALPDSANNDYWNTETEVFNTNSDAPQEDVFYTNTKGNGAVIKDVMVVTPGQGYTNGDIVLFSGANTVNGDDNIVGEVVTDITGGVLSVTLASSNTKYLQAPSIRVTNTSGGTANGLGATFEPILRFSNATFADESARGFFEVYVRGWANSRLRAGMFDDQNGLFFEFDGSEIYAVRRASTKQLSGTANTYLNSTLITGNGTQFRSQLRERDSIVIRGTSYTVTTVLSDSIIHVSPPYRSADAREVLISKTEDTRVKQSDWSIDPCFGTGPTGYNLDINKIQMIYIDYAWYGAGKARFGFKDQNGEVIYVHEFLHNNILTESYFRSGNLPCRYEVLNTGQPDYVPALMHWGTSVIMDGTYDDDGSYLFTASGDTLTFTGAGTVATTGRVITTSSISNSTLGRRLRETDPALYNQIQSFWYIRGDNYAAIATTVKGGVLVTQNALQEDTFTVIPPFPNPDNNSQAIVVINKRPRVTQSSSTAMTFGAANSAFLVGRAVPLVSMRLGPSVDNSNIGNFGDREIVNRMQLNMESVGVVATHDTVLQLILNGNIDNDNWQRLEGTPSLSQFIRHSLSDTIVGGVPVFTFNVPGGVLSGGIKTSNFFNGSIEDLLALGNSIMGGDFAFPNGPDILTIVARVTDFSNISVASPLLLQGRISWSEAQA